MSLFKIPSTSKQLAVNPMLDTQFIQIPPNRNVAGNRFAVGDIDYEFSSSSPDKYFIPSACYLRVRMTLARSDGTQLKASDEVAFVENAVAALFDNADYRIGDHSISRTSSYLPQIDTLAQRMDNSSSYIDGIGGAVGSWGSFSDRVAKTAAVLNPSTKNTSRVIVLSTFSSHLATNSPITNAVPNVYVIDPGLPLVNLISEVFAGDKLQILDAVDGIVTETHEITLVLANSITVGSGGAPAALVAGTAGRLQIVRSGDDSDSKSGAKTIEFCAPIPNAFFRSTKHAVPQAGRMLLKLHPSIHYGVRAVETRGPTSKSHVDVPIAFDSSKFLMTVDEMYFYLAETRGPEFTGKNYLLDIHEVEANSLSIPSIAFSNVNLNVHPHSKKLTCAFMDDRSDSDSRFSSTNFKAYGEYASIDEGALGGGYRVRGSTMKPINNQMNRFQLQYANRQFPTLETDNKLTIDIKQFAQRYYESQIWSGKLLPGVRNVQGRQETFEEFMDRGFYFHFPVDKPTGDDATHVAVRTGFAIADTKDVAHLNVILFHHTRSVIDVGFSADRRVVSVVKNTVP